MKKFLKIIISIFSVLIVLMSTFFIYTSIYYHAEDYENLDNIKCYEFDKYNLYTQQENNENLIIFYQGAKVEYQAYVPLIELIASENIDVALCKMPFNLAFFGMNYALDIINNYHYENVYIGGHSLGGAMSTMFAKDNNDKLNGVILLGSYATEIMPNNLKCLSIIGSEDKIVKKDKFNKNKDYFNKELYQEIIIEGGNHSYFCNYGLQKNDGTPTIDKIEQWNITAKYIKEFVI